MFVDCLRTESVMGSSSLKSGSFLGVSVGVSKHTERRGSIQLEM